MGLWDVRRKTKDQRQEADKMKTQCDALSNSEDLHLYIALSPLNGLMIYRIGRSQW